MYGSRGQTYRALDRLDAALADLDRALQLDPSDPWHLYQRSLVHRLANRPDRAGEDLRSAIRSGQEAADAADAQGRDLCNLALYRLVDGQVDAAEALYRQALQVDPTLVQEGLDDLEELEATGFLPPEGERCRRLLHSLAAASG